MAKSGAKPNPAPRAAQVIRESVPHILERLGIPVDELVNDSRKAAPGAVFVAYPGETRDGRDFIPQAVAQRVDGVLWDADHFQWDPALGVPNAGVVGLRHRIGEVAARVYGEPSRALHMVGVTGTNGKTSVAHWIAQTLTRLGRKTAVVGTVGNGFPPVGDKPGALTPTLNTTPDAIALQQRLAHYRRQGAVACAMEVSSHGLAQGRVNGTAFNVAVLTNLTRDHLDYHGDMDSYAAAKARLFAWPGLDWIVLNVDDAFGQRMEMETRPARVAGYGFTRGAVVGENLRLSQAGLHMKLRTDWGDAELDAPLLGRFNAANLLAVLTTLLVSDVKLADACAALAHVVPPPGRMETLGGGAHPLVVVDYAHTPDALEKALATLREIAGGGRLICVFGCGGNRDKGKRPLMGQAASKAADEVWVTSDNPRHEDPRAIIDDILGGVRGKPRAEPDRARAIFEAIGGAHQGDVVLIAGKGHEDYQEIAGERHPFSDAATARKALAAMDMNLKLSETAAMLGVPFSGRDAAVLRVSTDSRAIRPGDLFIALRGEKFDGGAFAAQALQQGAAGVVLDRTQAPDIASAIRVDDTRLALGQLAAAWRRRFDIPVVAITGSNGKTTVKEMLAAILRVEAGGDAAVLATEGNLNNDIGLPLMLLRLREAHQFAVFEMGMNHAGEIDTLTRLARPDVAVVNNALSAHIGFLGSVEAIARAKGEIFNGLSDAGIAVFNGDDPHAWIWREANAQRCDVDFGLSDTAKVRGRYQPDASGSALTLKLPNATLDVRLQVPGVHNVMNALAAAAAAFSLDVSHRSIVAGLSGFAGVKGRLQRKPALHGSVFIDDTYNANPDSVKAALAVLAQQPGRKLLVLGDMGELGDNAAAMHAQIGLAAHDAGVDKLLTLGELTKETVGAFGKGAMHFERIQELLAELENELNADTTVLVKGSRFMQMERVVDSFMETH